MKITEVYPKGGIDKMREPLNLEVSGLNSPGITILGRTWTRDGTEITIFYNGEQMSNHNYDFHRSLGYQNNMARDVAEDVQAIFEMNGLSVSITSEDLLPIMKTVRDKCESRYGNQLPDSDYEISVSFCATCNYGLKKITPQGLKIVLATNLYGTTIFDIIDDIQFKTESDRSIKENVIDNLKSMLKVVIEKQLESGSLYAEKSKKALRSLLDYGSLENSSRMEKFLKEAGNSKIILSKNDSYSFCFLFEPSNTIANTKELSGTLSIILNQCIQKG